MRGSVGQGGSKRADSPGPAEENERATLSREGGVLGVSGIPSPLPVDGQPAVLHVLHNSSKRGASSTDVPDFSGRTGQVVKEGGISWIPSALACVERTVAGSGKRTVLALRMRESFLS